MAGHRKTRVALPRPTRKISLDVIVVGHPEEFEPTIGEDVSAGNIQFEGFYLFHEAGPLCWCDPEVVSIDEETDTIVCNHKTTIN